MSDKQKIRVEQGARLKAARVAAGYKSARKAAIENSWPESTYRAHENGTRTVDYDDAERYAKRFKINGANVTGQNIIYGDRKRGFENSSLPNPFIEERVIVRNSAANGGIRDFINPEMDNSTVDVRKTKDIKHVALLDSVSAGKLVEPTTQIPVEDVPLLAFADLGTGDFFALRVAGTSMDRVSPDGSVIVANRREQTLISGKCYVFAYRGEVTYKRWQGGDIPYLEPYSTDVSHKPIFIKRKRDLSVLGRVKRSVLDL